MKNILIKWLFVSTAIILITSSASATTCTNLTKTLSKGSENGEVLKLQQFLFDAGYLTAKPNGYFGNGTIDAVKKFQKSNKILISGSVGQATKGKIKEISCSIISEKNKEPSSVSVNKTKESNLPITQLTSSMSSNVKFIEIGKDHSEIEWFKIVNGKLVYEAYDMINGGMGSKTTIVYDGKEIGKEYDSVSSPTVIDNKLAYIAVKNRKKFIVYDGVEIGKDYGSVSSIVGINNKLSYIATKKEGSSESNFYAIYDGSDLNGGKYDYVSGLREVNKKPLFIGEKSIVAKSEAGEKAIVYDGLSIGKGHVDFSFITAVNNKIAYIAEKNGKKFIVYDGKEIGKEYDSVNALTEVNGKVSYIAEKNGKKFIVYDGKEIGKEYNGTINYPPIMVDGKLIYEVSNNGHTFIVSDGKEICKEYDKCSIAGKIKEKLVYIGNKNNKSYLVRDGIEYDLGGKYDMLFNFTEIDGKVSFIAIQNKKSFIVMEK